MPDPLEVKESPGGVTFSVRVVPRSSRNEVAGASGGVLRVKLTAPPVEGAANRALVLFLSEKLGVAKSNITILTGQTGRAKAIRIEGIDKKVLISILH